MAYTKQSWEDEPSTSTPISAARLARIEDGIEAAAATADAALPAATASGTYVPLSQRGAANGVATLDAGGTVPDAQLPAAVARDSEVTAAVAAHEADTTSVHGIADTALLATQAELDAHAAAADPHAGYVLESLYDADTILKADADNTPSALAVGASTLVGRAAAGGIAALTAAQVRALLGVVGDWTDLGNLGAAEAIAGADDTVVRRKGTLDQACTITLTLAADQQIDLVLAQDGTGGRAATFSGVTTWMTQDGNAPVLTGRAALAVDRFYFEQVGTAVYGYWLTETVAAGGGSLTVQDENGAVATGVTQIDFQGAGVSASSGSGEVVVTIPGTDNPRVTTPLSPAGAVSERFFRHYLSLSSQAALASGRLSMFAIELLAGQVVSTISFFAAGTAGGGMTNQWFSLWDANRNLLGVTNDDGATAWTIPSRKTLTLTAPYTVPTSGLYYLGIVVVGSTMPSLMGASGSAALGGIAPILSGTSNTGLTDPASAPAVANALTADAFNPYAYVS